MTSFVIPSLLPPPLARDLNCRAMETLAGRLSTLDLTPLVVYDFDTVPASALPSLAEQFRVLGDAGWNLATTEAQQRALLKEAGALHRIRGTPYAVSRVLEILGLTASLAEWFATAPPGVPYTFTITADTLDQPDGSPPLDPVRWGQIARVVNFWKNARSGFGFMATSNSIALGTGVAMLAYGEETEAIAANFDGDAIGLPMLQAAIAVGSEAAAITATMVDTGPSVLGMPLPVTMNTGTP